MTEYKGFSNTKKKIEKIWNDTEQNLSNESKLIIQQIIDSNINSNPSLITIPLISKRETIYTSLTPHIPQLFEEFVIHGMTDVLLSFTKIYKKYYREELTDGNDELYLKSEQYVFNNISWKFIDDNTKLLQIYIPIHFFSNKTFMDVNLIIINPNIYTALPKTKI